MGFKFSFHSMYTNIFYYILLILHCICCIYLCFFQDLLNFDDPLNKDAAELFIKDKEAFRIKAKDYVIQYARR